MHVWQAIWQCIWKKYASGKGRASRGEWLAYCVFYLCFCGLWICGIFSLMYWCGDVNLIDFTLGYVPFFLLPPLVAVTVRRLHDISKTGWLSWPYLVPLINILALGLLFMPGKPYANRFGPEPVAIN